jgi:hypothetical protein
MVNLLELLYAITALALVTVLYTAMRGQKTETERLRYKGALWVTAVGSITCVLLYWYLA